MGKRRGSGSGVGLSVGAVLLMVALCCGVPTLLAGGCPRRHWRIPRQHNRDRRGCRPGRSWLGHSARPPGQGGQECGLPVVPTDASSVDDDAAS